MRDVLFLVHRLPYPPDKGEKIRAWNVLRHLASRYRVHLCTFVDAPEDTPHIDRLRELCASVFWRPLSRPVAALRGLRSLLCGASVTQGYFADARFGAEVDRIVARHDPGILYVFSSAMAPYVERHRARRVILDMVDVDSEKWRQYAETSPWPARALYAREARALLSLERRAAVNADAVTLVTAAEAALFAARAPETASRIHCVGNGVDADYFDPSLEFANPVGDRPALVFTGVMDYRPNADAMCWFVEQVMPRLGRLTDRPRLWIVGANPGPAVRALAGPDVCVTGRVPDVRPYLRHASVVVAPLRIARGIQNKVLEAMAMSAPVIVTPQIRQALDNCGDEILSALTPDEFVEAIFFVLRGGAARLGTRARDRIVRDYRWQTPLAALDRLLGDEPDQSGASPVMARASASAETA